MASSSSGLRSGLRTDLFVPRRRHKRVLAGAMLVGTLERFQPVVTGRRLVVRGRQMREEEAGPNAPGSKTAGALVKP